MTRTVSDVLSDMDLLTTSLELPDGVLHFNSMYRAVTSTVHDSLDSFEDRDFLSHLDVTFADIYLSALASTSPPRCWAALFHARHSSQPTPLQFALAGMNAHINHDLALALVRSWSDLSRSPYDPSVRRDFTRVNHLLSGLEVSVRSSLSPRLASLDTSLRGIPHHVNSWSIAAARRAAWDDALVLWRLRPHSRLFSHAASVLDEAVAATTHCLLLSSLCSHRAPHPHLASHPDLTLPAGER